MAANLLLNPSFEVDSITGGLADSWAMGGTRTGTPVYSLVAGRFGAKAQRVQYTGIVGDSPSKTLQLLQQFSAASSFAAGDPATFAIQVKGSSAGLTYARLYLDAYNAGAYISSASLDITPTSVWTRRALTRASLPVGTTRVEVFVLLGGIDNTDTVDLSFDGAKLEKSAIATAFCANAAALMAIGIV